MKTYDILLKYCKVLFYIGSGNYWHDKKVVGDDSNILYIMYGLILTTLILSVIVLEFMVSIIGDFPDEVQRDSLVLAYSRVIVVIKIGYVIVKKNRIKALNRDLADVCKNHEQEQPMRKLAHIIKINTITYFAIVYGTFLIYIIEGLHNAYHGKSLENDPFSQIEGF